MGKYEYKTIEEYMNLVEPEYRDRLEAIRRIALEETPDGVEKISWGLPTIQCGKSMIQFGACKGYVGFYPMVGAVEAFAGELKEKKYKTTKCAVHLPLNEEFQEDLVRRMSRYVVEQASLA